MPTNSQKHRVGRKLSRLSDEEPEVHQDQPQDQRQLQQDVIEPEKKIDIDGFLDTPFFDPNKVKDDSPIRWFADMVENDYETAEALYVGVVFFVLVVVSQELLRMQLYGEQYVPFHKSAGSLF